MQCATESSHQAQSAKDIRESFLEEGVSRLNLALLPGSLLHDIGETKRVKQES